MKSAVRALACLTCAACAHAVPSAQLTSAEYSSELGDDATGYARIGAAHRALSLADRAVQVSPASAQAHYDRAVVLQAIGRSGEAAREYAMAERLFGDSDPKGRSLAIYGRARANVDRGRCADARAAYEQFADVIRPTDPSAAELALAYAAECREPQPAPAGWHDYNRAVELAERGRASEAVASFVAAEQRFGDDEANRHGKAVAVYGRARTLERAGRCLAATRAYEEYAAMMRASDPEDADAALARARRCGVSRGELRAP